MALRGSTPRAATTYGRVTVLLWKQWEMGDYRVKSCNISACNARFDHSVNRRSIFVYSQHTCRGSRCPYEHPDVPIQPMLDRAEMQPPASEQTHWPIETVDGKHRTQNLVRHCLSRPCRNWLNEKTMCAQCHLSSGLAPHRLTTVPTGGTRSPC